MWGRKCSSEVSVSAGQRSCGPIDPVSCIAVKISMSGTCHHTVSTSFEARRRELTQMQCIPAAFAARTPGAPSSKTSTCASSVGESMSIPSNLAAYDTTQSQFTNLKFEDRNRTSRKIVGSGFPLPCNIGSSPQMTISPKCEKR